MDNKQEQSWISRRCQNMEPFRSWLGLAAAVCTILLVSLSDSFGVYYDALVEKYDSTRAAVGLIFSFRWIFILLSALFISPLVEIYGTRLVVISFGFLYASAIALSAVAPTVSSLYFIFGVLTGVGNSGMYMGAITALQQLFTTNRGFATGVATMGIPLGVLIHPLHTKYFLDMYGVSGVYLMHGAISLHVMIVGFAFIKPKRASSKQVKKDDHNVIPTISQPDVKPTPNQDNSAKASPPSNTNNIWRAIKQYLKGIADFALFKNIAFVLTIAHYMLLWTVRLGIASQIVNSAKFKGIADQKAIYLLSIFGFVGLCMTVVSSIIMNMSWLNPALYSGFAALCLSGSALGCAFSQSYEAFVVSAVLMGIADGVCSANLPLLVLYAVGLEKFGRGIALLWTILVPSAGSAALVGWMVDIQGNYVMAFLVLAASGIVSVVLSIIIVIIKRTKRKQDDFISEVTITTTI